MGQIYTTASGGFFYRPSGATGASAVSLPTGVAALVSPRRPSFQRFAIGDGLNNYVSGQYSSLLVWAPNQQLYKGGIAAPSVAPTVMLGAPGGVTGPVLVSFTWAQYIDDVLIHEGNPSPKSTEQTFTDQAIIVSGIPATAPDVRTTHWHVYVSVDGSLSYLAATVALGTTTTTITMDNEELFQQVTLPVKFDDNGLALDDILARGAPPYATIIRRWHRRMWYIDPTKPGVFFSEIDEMESVNENTDLSFLPTEGGEFPLCMAALDDELVVFCEDVFYSISGNGISSFRMRQVSDEIRFVCPFSPQNLQGMILFASDQGIMAYQGGGGNGFRNLMAKTFRTYWEELYGANTVAFENGCSGIDFKFGDYIFAPDWSTTRTIRGHYRPMVEDGEREPWWYFGDVRNRRLKALGQSFVSGTHLGLLTYAECDGQIYNDDAEDGTDAGDSYNKRMRVAHKHSVMGDQGGDDAHGRSYSNLDWFGLQNDNDVVVNCYGGDDTAIQATTPTTSETIEPLASVPGQTTQATSRSTPVAELAGKGVTVEIVVDNPVQVEHRGFAFLHKEGSQTRG